MHSIVAKYMHKANIKNWKHKKHGPHSRRVDKAGCIKLSGKFYEVGVKLIGKTVDIRFDPFDLALVEVWHNGKKKGTASPLVIQEYNDHAMGEERRSVLRRTAPAS